MWALFLRRRVKYALQAGFYALGVRETDQRVFLIFRD